MSKSRRHGHALAPSEVDEQHFRSELIPSFKTAALFAEKKIEMLERDFRIQLTYEQKLHLKTLKTEREINAAVRQIINDAWR